MSIKNKSSKIVKKVENKLPERNFNDPRNKKKIGFSPIKIGVVDIETTGLNASFGQILCAVFKTYSPDETKVFRIDNYLPWKEGKRADDSLLVKDILDYMQDIDIIIAHNGSNFDIPMIRTRALIHGYPPVNPIKIIDPVLLARKVFRFHSNSLNSIASMLETESQKTPLSPKLWANVIGNGDTKALQYIVEHCEADVEVLEEVTWRIRKYVKNIDVLGSWRS